MQPDRDTKAELNRRSQVCEVLTGTGISRRGKWTERRVTLPLDLAPEASASLLGYTLKQMVEHQGSAPCIPVWKTGVYLSTPMFVGNPVLELIERLLCHTTSVAQGLRLEMNDALASAEYRSAVVNKPSDDVLKAALRSIRSLSSVEHAQFSQLAA